MTTQQMIEEIQEKIADKTLSFGCIIGKYVGKEGYRKSIYGIAGSNGRFEKKSYGESDIIIGHPVSLSRVLSALQKETIVQVRHYYQGSLQFESHGILVCKRQLLKEDGSDAYLGDQSDKTIRALHGLIIRYKYPLQFLGI